MKKILFGSVLLTFNSKYSSVWSNMMTQARLLETCSRIRLIDSRWLSFSIIFLVFKIDFLSVQQIETKECKSVSQLALRVSFVVNWGHLLTVIDWLTDGHSTVYLSFLSLIFNGMLCGSFLFLREKIFRNSTIESNFSSVLKINRDEKLIFCFFRFFISNSERWRHCRTIFELIDYW